MPPVILIYEDWLLLRAASIAFVVSKLSAGDIIFKFGNDKSFSIGVVQDLVVQDPTGAGDSFGGGLVSALAEGLSIEQAMIRGTAMASFCIEDFGISSILNAKKKWN